MKTEFIPYELALALKELGFDEPCFGEWQNLKTGKNLVVDDEDRVYDISILGADIKAPLYQQAFRWFREKYDLEGVIQQAEDFKWYKWKISQYNEDGKKYVADWYEYKTYEEAELECLKKLIEIVKNGKQ